MVNKGTQASPNTVYGDCLGGGLSVVPCSESVIQFICMGQTFFSSNTFKKKYPSRGLKTF